jgi:hypothetical protein
VAAPSTATRRIAAAATARVTPAASQPSRVWQRLTLVSVDLLAVNLAFYLAWVARYRLGLIRELDPGNYIEHEVYLPLPIALSLMFVLIVAMRGQ